MNIPIDLHEQARSRAEARAKAAIAASQARAEAVVAAAEARAAALLAGYQQRFRDIGRHPAGVASGPPSSGSVEAPTGQGDPSASWPGNPESFFEAVAVHAYYKAEQRGFEPGRATDDWLAAERELLAVSSDVTSGAGA